MSQTVLLRGQGGRRSSIRAKRGKPQAMKCLCSVADRPANIKNAESALGRDEKAKMGKLRPIYQIEVYDDRIDYSGISRRKALLNVTVAFFTCANAFGVHPSQR